MKPDKHQGANKDAKIYVGRSTIVHRQSFVLRSNTMHELRNQNLFYWLVPRSVLNSDCVLCTVKAKKEN